MTTVMEETVNCPCCHRKITILDLGSTNSFGRQYTDFHSQTMGYAPMPILMNTCPDCGFSGYNKDFKNPLDETLKSQICTVITPLCQVETLNAGRRYELYGKIRQLAGDNVWELGNNYLQGAWAAFDEGTDNEAYLRRLALEYFREALVQNLVPLEQEATITYLIGELYRRIGEIEAANTWFNKVIQRAQTDESWQQMAQFATQQRDHPQEVFSR
ncbi:DUF2225 domain-containing protein [Planktothrix mougeotii]|uniref:DUF2225 domain-containing protein n=1 Tax=Planktothrix mougeotii LEGE 06226 TaxID=1828728 RepID=A0ABR9UBV1_9CYAN|nr:DUF2225 domain-containing protein [Planktothrix mougeotii]MBE9143933.1 DUF2225 domain-containing protein [Planktothrix mougeotii LEGE 06226]